MYCCQQADDALVSQLSHAIKKVAERATNAPETVEFDYFSSTNFIGLFITEQFAALLKQITADFAEEMKKTGEHNWNNGISVFVSVFLARDSMLSALYAIANPSVRPSVCPSVRHTGGSVENG